MSVHCVLALDVAGTPVTWITPEEAVSLYARDKVAWDLGVKSRTFRGGVNRQGLVSKITIRPIVATSGANLSPRFDACPLTSLGERGNPMLFRRDRNTCAYCGSVFDASCLTRDHIVPRSKGGLNTWMNCVTACFECNQDKADMDVSDFRPLIYLPYVPNRFERFILSGRNILADQHEYLSAKLPTHSRLRN